MKYSRNISIVGVLIGYYKKNIYISSKNVFIKNSVKKTLSDLFIDKVSGNIKWEALDMKETSQGINLVFIGLVDYRKITVDYSFKTLKNRLTKFEELAVRDLSNEIEKFNSDYIQAILGNAFLIRELFELYKLVVDKKKDRANFYKLVRKKDYIVPVGRRKREVYHRPPEYFKIR